jgi:allophanate hydrolase subunit 2
LKLKVLRISAGATLQDAGRCGWKHCGVPQGGAFDKESLALANALVGNEPEAPALELSLLGGLFECAEPGACALVGGEREASLRGSQVPTNSAFGVICGDRLLIGPITKGVRLYLAAHGGWHGEPILGSVSGQPVDAGSVLESAFQIDLPTIGNLRLTWESLRSGPFRIIRPNDVSAGFEKLLSDKLRVSVDSDRRGIRLEGAKLEPGEEKTSEPICVGAVQLTPSGQLIVIGPDGPTIGGYPQIAFVCEADLDRLAQLRPGDEVRFEEVTLEEARERSRDRTQRIARQSEVLRKAAKARTRLA